MKFKVKILSASQLSIDQEPAKGACYKLSKNINSISSPVAIPGDQIEFQKQVYQTIQSFVRKQDRDWCRQVLREISECQAALLGDLIDRVLQDSLRSVVTKIQRNEEITTE